MVWLNKKILKARVFAALKTRANIAVCFGMLLLLMLVAGEAAAQTSKVVNSREQVWLAYFNQTRFNNRFGLWLDVHYRLTDNFAERPFQFLFRPALTTYIKDNLRVQTGYTYVAHFPAEGLETTRPEHRIWEQIWWSQKYKDFIMLQWLRFEQRFLHNIANDQLQDGYTRANRLRYNVAFTVPLKGKEMVAGTPFVVMSNELFINFGKNVVYNTFDQNRFFIGAGYQITKGLNTQLGYMNNYQQESTGNHYMVSHVIRVNINQAIDLR